jgi:hypothetical protein
MTASELAYFSFGCFVGCFALAVTILVGALRHSETLRQLGRERRERGR